jgi:hypothetical protein
MDTLRLQVTSSKPRGDGTYSVSHPWLFRFSLDGKEQRMGLGPLDKLCLEDAGLEARLQQKLVDQKINPIEERDRQQVERAHAQQPKTTRKTFRECAQAHIAWLIVPPCADRTHRWSKAWTPVTPPRGHGSRNPVPVQA